MFEADRPVWSFRELTSLSARIATGLSVRRGLRRGDRVALVMRNCPAYLALFFACWRGGLICVPVNAKLHAREIAHILDDSGAALVFVTADLVTTVEEACGFMQARNPQALLVDDADYRALAASDEAGEYDSAAGDAAWLL